MVIRFLRLVLLLIGACVVDAFLSPVGSNNRPSSSADTWLKNAVANELEEIWSQAARSGADAVLTTADLVKDRAFEYKRRALDRIHAMPSICTKQHDAEQLMRKYDADCCEALALSEARFLKAIEKAEERLAHSIKHSEAAYDRGLSREKHWTSDVVLRAKNHFIQETAAAEELFQIAVEKAELNFEESKIKAESWRDLQLEYFADNGEYMHDEMAYLSLDFSNLIAF